LSPPATGFPRLLALGDAAFTVEFGGGIAPEIHARVLGFAAAHGVRAQQRDDGGGVFGREVLGGGSKEHQTL